MYELVIKAFCKFIPNKEKRLKKQRELLRKNMKIGVSYNLFDGEELLPFSIKSVRNKVHYINVVYQSTSNFGNSANPDLKKILEDLKQQGLIDEIYFFEPDLKSGPHQNEKNKRDIGLELAKKNGCNYFMSMDADEFYDEEQFEYAINYIISNNIKTSALNCIEYLKSPENQIITNYSSLPDNSEMFNYYVPFIIKIHPFKKQHHGEGYFSCHVDPTRGLAHKGRFKLFSSQEIVMQHMSTVRRDLSKKYENTSALDTNKTNQEFINALKKDILEFDFEKNKELPQNCAVFRGSIVRKVANKFNIEL